ncbi:unnamed protein product [Angiostrongylus costaricensis]|uniref:VHL domain-containing protein n=1 Tax=Angiostrongylus costaricensis TaxID=334426 RepID=A0A0R3Q1V1_ANGCS|nr:unnamed protein product [Angiostrongylus costaricensis]
MIDGIEAGDDVLTGKQRCRKKRLVNTLENGANAEEVQSRGRPKTHKSDGDGANFQLGETSTDKQTALSTRRVLLEQTRNNMAFRKGTFLIRYEDLDKPEYAGHIWLVNSHRLLQKYTFDGIYASNVRVFSRTNRFSGWLHDRSWLYHPLYDVESVLGKMEKVAIRNHPTRDELFARRNAESRRALETELEQMKDSEKTGASGGGNSNEEHE